MTDWDSIVVDAIRAADRRLALCRLQPHCPSCGDAQVQLLPERATPARWRCRVCKHRFEKDLPEGGT